MWESEAGYMKYRDNRETRLKRQMGYKRNNIHLHVQLDHIII